MEPTGGPEGDDPLTSASQEGRDFEMLSGGAWQIVAALLGFAYFPVLARVIEADALGAWSMLMVYALLLRLCDLGLSAAVQRVAVRGDKELTRAVVAFALKVIVILAPVGVLAAYLALSKLPPEWMGLRASIDEAAPLALLSGFLVAYGLPFRAYLYTQGAVRSAALGRAAGSILQTMIVASGFVIQMSLRLLALAAIAGSMMDLGICMWAARRRDAQLPLLPGFKGRPQTVRPWVLDGLGALAVNVFEVIALRVDVLILSERTRSSPAVVGVYNYAGRLVEQPYLVTKQVLSTLTPRLGSPAARGEAVRTGTIVFTSLIITGMSALALNSRELVVLVFGQRLFRFAGALDILGLALGLLALAYVILSTYEVSSPMLTLGGRTAWAAAFPILVGGTLKYALSFWGAPRWGIWAIAGSTSVGYAITGLWTWFTARKLLGWTWARLLGVFAVPLSTGGVALAVGLALRPLSTRGWIESLLACAVTCLVGVGVLVAMLRRRARCQAREGEAAAGTISSWPEEPR